MARKYHYTCSKCGAAYLARTPLSHCMWRPNDTDCNGDLIETRKPR
jgi:hypothetical protein